MSNEYFISLQSCLNNNEYPTNRFSKFRNNLPSPLRLDGEWKASLIDISLPVRYYNVQTQTLAFVAPIRTPKDSTALDSYECKIDKKMEESINSTLLTDDMGQDMFHSAGSPGKDAKVAKRNKVIRICRTARLSAAFYLGVDELCAAIVQLYQNTFNDLFESGDILADLRISYSPLSNMLNLHSKLINDEIEEEEEEEEDLPEIPPILIFAKNKILLQYHFGLKCLSKSFDKGYVFFYVETDFSTELYSTNPCNLRKYAKLYVSCDCIEYSSIGNNVIKLLTSIPISSDKKTIALSTSYPTTRYHTVRSTLIDSIEIELLSNISTHELFPSPINPSDTDFVECTLHFKRVSDIFPL